MSGDEVQDFDIPKFNEWDKFPNTGGQGNEGL